MVQNFPAVEDKCGLGHVIVDPLVVQTDELVPLRADHHGVGCKCKEIIQNFIKINKQLVGFS